MFIPETLEDFESDSDSRGKQRTCALRLVSCQSRLLSLNMFGW